MKAAVSHLFFTTVASMAIVGMAHGQACVPPVEPYPYAPPDNDPELREYINQEYADYMESIEDYMRCLQNESRRAFSQADTVFKRWIQYFGKDAVIRYDSAE
ncbi:MULTISPECIES: hypothetical protein [Aurantimonadaceae]|uniref:Secreted protein n=2 Tax=Jiella TaxID=1775688 RepID=A0A6N9TAU2_9HYPH|nr:MULTISPECIES: hypothetical protein [Aurantimonadaceae]MAU95507.1 hypothetical protein [Fulvimarina sp.]NDW06819.1 hypothetical protein [Jiella pacifica]ORE97085.1 hypothetical protein ATO4_11319 [Aurantimonas sp. 22II-16-19i]WAP71483.1 hypothetical protein OH818_28025 [Jiella pelagia]